MPLVFCCRRKQNKFTVTGNRTSLLSQETEQVYCGRKRNKFTVAGNTTSLLSQETEQVYCRRKQNTITVAGNRTSLLSQETEHDYCHRKGGCSETESINSIQSSLQFHNLWEILYINFFGYYFTKFFTSSPPPWICVHARIFLHDFKFI